MMFYKDAVVRFEDSVDEYEAADALAGSLEAPHHLVRDEKTGEYMILVEDE